KKRSETVEWIFGNIKQNMKFREFLTRGLENVRTEYNLVCSAHNLKIIWGKLSRDAAVIGTILGSVTNLVSKVKNFLGFHPIVNFKCHC
ncbi:MAG TPA: transposase, partial [Desulfobacteria bacterium]|nr:transposase [Desulfobacteria bacterium]